MTSDEELIKSTIVMSTNRIQNFYRNVAKDYDIWKITNGLKDFLNLEKRFLKHTILPGSKVIDFGCGTGEHLFNIVNKKCDITAVDFVEEMLDQAKVKIGDRAKYICSDINKLDFLNNSFDFGICYCTLPNHANYRKTFNKISRMCKALIISVYHWENHYELERYYKDNHFHPYVDSKKKAIYLKEGLRYLFISEKTILDLYNSNDFESNPCIRRHKFGNLYLGVKKST